MDDLSDTRQISRLEIVDTGRRRRWSAAEKLRIVEESFSAPRLASATARRHGISNQLLFAWRKAYREGRLGDIPGFVPATIVLEQPEKGTGTGCRRIECQSALNWAPRSACKRDPFERRVLAVALAPSELAGVAETARA